MSEPIARRPLKAPPVLVISLGVLAAVLLVAAFYASPYIVPGAIRSAAIAEDSEKLEELIDFPRVREGLKSDLKALMAQSVRAEMAKDSETADNPLAAGFAQLALGMVGQLVDGVVDEVASPAGLIRIAEGKPPAGALSDAAVGLNTMVPKDASGDGFTVEGRYLGFDRFRYTAVNDKQHTRFLIDMRRKGLFGWQVTRVTPKLDLTKFSEPATVAAAPPPAAPEAPQQITRLVGAVSEADTGALLAAIGDASDSIIGLKVSVEAGADGGPPTGEQLILYTDEYEVLFPASAVRYEHGVYVIDGFFLVKSGGMHQGVLSFGLEAVDEADVRLKSTIADRVL